ncbi:MAG: B12-binding domain-containing radical SAM protein [Chloroflexi bacterium]|nr:B12-binding domain-containing radical SAM protein [Chloroflexota bacterium]
MRITLVNTNISRGMPDFLRAEIQLGLIYLAPVLEQGGHDVELIDLNFLIADESWPVDDRIFKRAAGRIAGTSPDLIGINTRCDSFPTAVNIASALKKRLPDTPIVLGGGHVTFLAAETLTAFPFIDFVLRGEAEYSLLELADALENKGSLKKVRGLTFRKNGVVIENPDAELPEDLDRLPAPSYRLYAGRLKAGGGKAGKEIFINVGRGCPFRCKFCISPAIYRGKYRMRSPESIIGEMKMLKEKYGIYRFSLGVDHFLVDRDYVKHFCRLLVDEKLDIAWGCNARPENIDEEIISLMKESGLTSLYFGIESGSKRIQKKIGKNIRPGGVIPILKTCENYDLVVIPAFILGFPGEEESDMDDTIRLAIECSTFYQVFPEWHVFSPMAGSSFYDEYKDSLIWTGLLGDSAEGPASHIPANLKLVRKYPRLFSVYYNVPLKDITPWRLFELIRFYANAIPQFPITLKTALEDLGVGPVHLSGLFREWAAGKKLLKAGPLLPSHADLLELFPEFIRSLYRERGIPRTFMETVLSGESRRASLKFSRAQEYIGKMGDDGSPLIKKVMSGRLITKG